MTGTTVRVIQGLSIKRTTSTTTGITTTSASTAIVNGEDVQITYGPAVNPASLPVLEPGNLQTRVIDRDLAEVLARVKESSCES